MFLEVWKGERRCGMFCGVNKKVKELANSVCPIAWEHEEHTPGKAFVFWSFSGWFFSDQCSGRKLFPPTLRKLEKRPEWKRMCLIVAESAKWSLLDHHKHSPGNFFPFFLSLVLDSSLYPCWHRLTYTSGLWVSGSRWIDFLYLVDLVLFKSGFPHYWVTRKEQIFSGFQWDVMC